MIKHILSGGFVYLMIVNGFSWMYLVIQSFSRIGSAISGIPALSPESVLDAGLNLASTLLNSPTASGIISSLELAVVEAALALVVAAAFIFVAVELLLTLVKAYLTVGLGVILLGFGGNRFTASASEGYFTNVIRVGVKLLFFYAVLAIGMQLVAQWEASLAAACKPVATTVPMTSSYFVPPSKIITTVCSGTITLSDMLGYTALAAVFAAVAVAVPSMAAELIGGTVGLALAHAFEAAYIAQTVVRPITSALHSGFNKIAQAGGGKTSPNSDAQAWQSMANFNNSQSQSGINTQPTAPLINPNSGSHRAIVQPTTALRQGTNALPANKGTIPMPNGGGATTRLSNGASVTAPIGKPPKP
jgi:type IV secretory pathway TrbL component